MGFFSALTRLFKKPEAKSISHPELGEIYYSHTLWHTDHCQIGRFNHIECTLDGNTHSPDQDAIEACLWARDNWEHIFGLIAKTAYNDVYEPYTDAPFDVPQIDSAEALEPTIELLGLSFTSKNTFEVSMRFTWQDANDDHLITFYVEHDTCTGVSIDG